MKLLVLNYSMDPQSVLFSHQRDVVKRLSLKFERTFVITSDKALGSEINNVDIKWSGWKRKNRIISLIHFYRSTLPVLLVNRKKLVVFSHMTEIQSLLIAPLCRLLGIPHYLWYAHKNKSIYLTLVYPFLTGLITSTEGSCPIDGSKVHLIGQAIDHQFFTVSNSIPANPPLSWYHVGRMDASKNIQLIIDVFFALRGAGWNLKLDFYGAPSSGDSQSYFDSMELLYSQENNLKWLTFCGPVERTKIPALASKYDGFVHAFQGSLDKAVLEATMCKRVVVSINPEFEEEFNLNSKREISLFDKLFSEMNTVLQTPESEQHVRIETFYELSVHKHSLSRWIDELLKVIPH